MSTRKSFFLLSTLVGASLATPSHAAPSAVPRSLPAVAAPASAFLARPRGVVLFIGDGMSLPQVYAARAYKGLEHDGPVGRLSLDALPVLACLDNHSEDALVPDAGATAIALATGTRVANKSASTDASGSPVVSIVEQVRGQGRATGFVTTLGLTSPTVAAFAAPARARADELAVAARLVDAPVVDVLLGGGRAMFLPEGVEDGRRADGRNLRDEMRAKGYTLVATRDELGAAASPQLLGLFETDTLPYEIDRDEGQPSLAFLTTAALRTLSRCPKGFFLVVEGGKIDWACHANDLGAAVRDTLAFDDAVAAALTFQKAHPDTLVLVTGDHETGGLALPGHFDPAALRLQKASVEKVLGGIAARDLDPNNDDFMRALRDRLALTPDVPLRERLKLAQASPKEVLYLLTGALVQRTRASFATRGHTALPPLLWARGPGQGLFGGSYDITGVHARLARLLGLKAPKPRSPGA